MSTPLWKLAVAVAVAGACVPRWAAAQLTVGRGIIEREVAPGARYRGSIPITNGTREPRRVRLFQTDFAFDAEGENRFGAPGSAPRSSAPWTTLGSAELLIPAGRTVAVEYSVVVPAPGGAPLTGSYWSAVMVEEIPPATAERVRRDARGLGVRQVMRTAVILVTHIANSGAAELSFEAPRVVSAQEGAVLQVDVRNTGTRAVRPALTGELFDAGGRSLGKVRGEERMLYPGTSARYRFALGAAPAGKYTAVVLGDAGGDAVFGAQYRVSF